jgi:hypothetical protein
LLVLDLLASCDSFLVCPSLSLSILCSHYLSVPSLSVSFVSFMLALARPVNLQGNSLHSQLCSLPSSLRPSSKRHFIPGFFFVSFAGDTTGAATIALMYLLVLPVRFC